METNRIAPITIRRWALVALTLLYVCASDAQTLPGRIRPGRVNTGAPGTANDVRPARRPNDNDSLARRNPHEDSITIYFRYFDSTRIRLFDSSLNDFSARSPLPYHYYHLGNMGTAARSYIFQPLMKPGWDAGFHAFDPYRLTLEGTRFFQTTRPYTELGYLLGSKGEQWINILHTQNRSQNLNFAFEYRFINAPGFLRSQNASHSSFRINAAYVSNNKRYSNFFVYTGNKMRSSENGGLRNPARIDSLSLNDPFELETRLNGEGRARRDFFNTNVVTGNVHTENVFYFRQQYDFGTRDSLVADTVTYQLFYPRIRLQHNLLYGKYRYNFLDQNKSDSLYLKYFNYIHPSDTVFFVDEWREITNEFSVISFPEKNNLNQFLKLGAGLQLLEGRLQSGTRNLTNIYALAEYRNRTRNRKWEVEIAGRLYTAGENLGDYRAFISLKRLISRRVGFLEAGFENVNRRPSYALAQASSFPFIRTGSFAPENTSRIFGSLDIASQNLQLSANYYIISNYTLQEDFFRVRQEQALFNVLHAALSKKFRLNRRWNLYSEVHLQQTAGNPPINLPLLFTRQRLAFEGNFYRNLNLSTGIELRYHTPFKADNYSPFTARFFYQDTLRLSNRPDINLFFHFRIKRFTSYVRLENLNTLGSSSNGVGFTDYNFRAPYYPQQALWLRIGIFWNFIN